VESVLAALLSVAVLPAAVPVTVTVAFSAHAQAELERYGQDDAAALRGRIETAVAGACGGKGTPEGLAIAVTVEDIAPTHPTRGQRAANPSLDPVRSRSLGGADLTGVLHDSRGHVLATVRHQYYPPTLQWGSPSLEPWADAGLAIEQFASQMGEACRRATAG
jgi:hypothetical protein